MTQRTIYYTYVIVNVLCCRFAVPTLVYIGNLNTSPVFHLIDSGTDTSILWKKQDHQESVNPSFCLSCVEQMVLTPGNVQLLTRAFCKCLDAASRHRVPSALCGADSTLAAHHAGLKRG